jgi:hypothetical protein
MAIISVLSSLRAESPRLGRYRNEVAASLLEIKPRNANTDGLMILRKLAASAPNPDGDVVFLPTQRAVNVLKALQAWVLAEVEDEEDEMSEDVESAMLPVFVNLAPILQSVSGSHWPFMFDVLESVLDRASAVEEDDRGYDVDQQEAVRKRMVYGVLRVALARALRFVIVTEELTTRNKSLMEDWKERRTGIMKSVLNLEILRSSMSVSVLLLNQEVAYGSPQMLDTQLQSHSRLAVNWRFPSWTIFLSHPLSLTNPLFQRWYIFWSNTRHLKCRRWPTNFSLLQPGSEQNILSSRRVWLRAKVMLSTAYPWNCWKY